MCMCVVEERWKEGRKKEKAAKEGSGGGRREAKRKGGRERKGWRGKLKETLHTYVKAEIIPLSDGDLSPLPHPPQLLHAPMLSSEAC